MDKKSKYMTEKERERVNAYISDLRDLRAGMSHLVSEWNEIERAYIVTIQPTAQQNTGKPTHAALKPSKIFRPFFRKVEE